MTAKDKAEILAKKASCSYWTDSSCKTVSNHILKVIPLTELLAVAAEARQVNPMGEKLNKALLELDTKLPKELR